MTNQLKELMTDALEHEAPYAPDLTALVSTGRRQVRRRRLVTATATAAAICVVAASTVVAFKTMDRADEAPVAPAPTTLPWGLPSMPPGGSTGVCTTADGATASAWNWPLVVSVNDTFGYAMVRKLPTGPAAFCTTEWGNGARLSVVPGRSPALVLRKSAAEGRGAAPRSSVTSVFGPAPKGRAPKVTVQTADGYVGVATVRNGYFVYRRVEHSPWPGQAPHAIVRFQYPGQHPYVAASR
ncbi:hypothetical protein AB0E69_16900 [Kribbella sp. NPDC026611]|uniref:hypothetical protein n=1 Tax=Kribbella sp. NPDC026611 TaxID=3154911 RepID=UPI0033EDF199